MFVCRPIQIRNLQKIEIRLLTFLMFYFLNWNLQFLHLPKNCFCCPGHEQVSLWWINSNFSISISINLNDKTFSLATFLILYPLNSQQGPNPHQTKSEQNAALHCVHPICQKIVYKNYYKISILACTPNYGL